MKVNAYLDSFLFAWPHTSNATDADYISYIYDLQQWKEMLNTSWIQTYILADTPLILNETVGFPNYDAVQKIITDTKLTDVVQVMDILQVVTSLLMRIPEIEEETGLVELEPGSIHLEPNYFLANRQPEFINAHYQLHAQMALHKEVVNVLEGAQMFITRGISEEPQYASYKATIKDLLLTNQSMLSNVPTSFDEKHKICSSFEGLQKSIDTILLWQGATSEEDMMIALNIHLIQTKLYLGSPKDREWFIRSEFFESAREHGFIDQADNVRKILRSCTSTVYAEDLGSCHRLRINSSGGSPFLVRKSDKANAWRRDIDYDYHLHYWSTATGIEFTKIVPHHVMSIPE